ncbi:restriction endonuclease subunit S [Barnesiella intestinihominis]|uniref:restriction endonuclease subunit S n=1 Tax=Barnesiella intestinihominis TaxID=487174 RepID=UPI0025947110|nr:restriction endonuclease subunit S [Barnesiella intestinihominis]
MDIPQGYKQTELGIIPEDWEIVNLGSVAKINGRIGFRGYTTADLVGVGQGAYTIGGKHITNMVLDLHDAEYISWQKYYESPEIMVRKGDIVFAQRGTLGKSAFIVNDIGPATINPSLVLINKIKCDNEYLSYWLQCDKIVEYICSINSQTSIPMITQNQIEHIPVVLSRIKAEQQAIAEALGDIDGLIATLNKKIAKKRLIKQGAMSQLLTGKKRLPGFSGPWMERKLGAISHIKTGSCNGDQAVDNGKYPFFVRSQKVYAIDSYSYDGEAILVPGEGGIGSIFHYINGKFDYHQRVYKISDFADNVCGKYIFFYMSRYFGEYALSLTVKATVDSLRLPTFEEFVICMPLNIEEQQAIATILNDMDKEIDDLEAQRDKYRLLKSGMMQKLLTGQIRLKIK